MGIQHLKKIIDKYAPLSTFDKMNLSEFSGKIFAIDTSIYLYRFSYYDCYVNGIVKQIMMLLKHNILPFYVFDGKPPQEKSATIKERSDRKENLGNKASIIESLINKTEDKLKIESSEYEKDILTEYIKSLSNELYKVNKSIINISRKDIEKTVRLLEGMGVPYTFAPGEAEVLCAELNRCNIVHGVLSEDTDVLANGGSLFIRNFSVDKNYVSGCYLDKLLIELNFSYDEFVDMCILCGCDYTTKISGIGYISAYKLISIHKNIESIISDVVPKCKKYNVPDNFNYIKARELFKQCTPSIFEYKKLMTMYYRSIENVVEILTNEGVNIKIIKSINTHFYNYSNNVRKLSEINIPVSANK